MVKAIFDELKKESPKTHFTIGIHDDVTHTSLEWDSDFTLPDEKIFQAIFFGLGSDGTVGANKNSIKIIGTQTDNYAQGYFVYDSKKSGSMTISHLRFGPDPIHSTYLIDKADFVACHQNVFMEKFDILQHAKKGAIFLLNSPFDKEGVWRRMPRVIQEEIIQKEIKFYVIDAYKVAKENKMGRKINTIMQTCFFAISGVLPHDEAIRQIKISIQKTYGKKSDEIVQLNYTAVDNTLNHLYEVTIPDIAESTLPLERSVKGKMSEFVANVTAHLIEGRGDELPVSRIPADGTWPSGTTQYEKRNIAKEVPVWDPKACIQCNKCVLVCPHAVIRSKVVEKSELADAPDLFKSIKAKGKNFSDEEYFTIQVAVEDCTGCSSCVEVCPGKSKTDPERKAINMTPKHPLLEEGIRDWDYFLNLSEYDRSKLDHSKVKESQFLQPLFEFSGTCPGCGETPYIKLATQLFGDRMIVANADQHNEAYIFKQRKRVERLKKQLHAIQSDEAEHLLELADYLVKKSVWIIGGDGWAYDIGYGGLDHVLASGKNVNILVLDTQVYSNTGGQQSKATPTGAVAKFASGGKPQLPKDLAMMAIAYGNVYVARVAMGASDTQTIKAFIEAERYDGPSLIIAYSHCIAHGYDLKYGMHQQKLAVDCGLWPTFRYDPEREKMGENPMKLDYKGPKIPVKEYMYNETRFKMVENIDTQKAMQFLETATFHAKEMYKRYENLTKINYQDITGKK